MGVVESATIEDRSRLPWLARRLGEVEAENRRLRNLLKITGGVEPPPEQAVLVPHDPGRVTKDSSLDDKVAFATSGSLQFGKMSLH